MIRRMSLTIAVAVGILVISNIAYAQLAPQRASDLVTLRQSQNDERCNLALRVLLNDMLLLDANTDRFAAGLLPVRRILIISVDGQSAPNPNWPRHQAVSGLGQIISAVISAQIGAYNIETLIAVESAVDDLVGKLRTLRCRQGPLIQGYACDDVAGKIIRVSLPTIPTRNSERGSFAIRTGLTLPRELPKHFYYLG